MSVTTLEAEAPGYLEAVIISGPRKGEFISVPEAEASLSLHEENLLDSIFKELVVIAQRVAENAKGARIEADSLLVESILANVRMLPLRDQVRLCKLLVQEASAVEIEARHEAIRQAKGSMAGLLPSTMEFLAEKHAELEAEMSEARQ
ncbi:MAG: hypothetical protein ACREBD_19905 [Blastocatellia bacterium]